MKSKIKNKKPKIKAVISHPIESKLYSVSLTILGKETEIKADTLFEAFDQIKPAIVRGKAIIAVKKGKLKAEIVLHPFQLKRLMTNRTFKMITEKRLNLLLK